MTMRQLSFVDLQNTTHLPYSSIAPATTDGMNAIVKFLADARPKTTAGRQIGRSLFVKAEDEAFIRQLQVQILGLTRADMSYVNELLLPTQLTQDTKIRWNTIQFVPGVMMRNPALGVNYTNERVMIENEASANRVGQHFEIEGDAWYTEKGQKDFQMQIMYWSVTVADTLAMKAWAELTRFRPESRRSYFMNYTNEVVYNQQVLRERDDMFAPYKDSKGIYRLVQDQCELVAMNTGKEATIMVMPREKSGLIMNGTSVSTYQVGGERGVSMLMSKGYLGEIVPGLKVYAPPRFVINTAQPATSPLDNTIRVGSYHIVKFNVKLQGNTLEPIYPDLPIMACLDKLYDENEDRWKSLPSLLECLKNRPGFLKKEYNNSDVIDMLKNDVDFVVVAPFAGYRTQGTLVAASGPDAGITTMSEPIVTKGEDAMTQVFKFNMTCWMGAYVFDPRRFLVSPHVFLNGILGGGSVSLINKQQHEKLLQNEWEDGSINRPSMYFLALKKTPENNTYHPDYIDLRGKARFGNEFTFPNAQDWSRELGWDQIETNDGDEINTQPIAPICFRREYNRWNGTKYCYEPGDTHHGKLVGVGSRDVRRYGKMVPENIITEATKD